MQDGFVTRVGEKIAEARRLRCGRTIARSEMFFTRNQGASSIFWWNAIVHIPRMRRGASFGAEVIICRGRCNWRKRRFKKIAWRVWRGLRSRGTKTQFYTFLEIKKALGGGRKRRK